MKIEQRHEWRIQGSEASEEARLIREVLALSTEEALIGFGTVRTTWNAFEMILAGQEGLFN